MVLATGGIGKSFKVTSNSWEYTGDGHALALLAGAPLINMEFVQFHPTGMVWPPSVKGILVTESVRGDGGVLRNSEGKRFMFDYVPDVFKEKYAQSEEEADGWYEDPDNNRRPPELLPRDEVARAINSEVKAGRGSPHGGVFLDVSTRMPAEEIRRRLPSMYHQFKELADVDITAEPMEVGPTCHYVMGGVDVDSGHRGRARRARACSRRARSRAACTAPTGSAATRCPTCWSSAGGPGCTRPSTRRGSPRRPAVRRGADRRGGGRGAAALQRGGAAPGGATGKPAGEPVHPPPGAPADDERPGRHHPAGGRDGAGAGEAGRPAGAGAAGRGRGPPAVQPGLAPRAGPAEHAAGQRVRRARGAGAHREPRRAHPRGLPRDGARLAAGQPAVPLADPPAGSAAADPVRGQIQLERARRPTRSAPTCSPCSTRKSWSSTSPKRSSTQ